MIKFKRYIKSRTKFFNDWVVSHYFQIALFNIFLLLLFLLRSAGYFHPFLPITVNFIVFTGLVAAIFLFGARSPAFFLLTLLFWILASFFKIVKIDVWAERTVIYAFQALSIGAILLLIENIAFKGKAKR